MERLIVVIFIAGILYLVFRGKMKKPQPKPVDFHFPNRPLRMHFVVTPMKHIRRLHWNLDASAVRHYGYDGARVWESFGSIWDKTEAESDGSHSWDNKVTYYVQRDGVYRLNEKNEEFFSVKRAWAEDFLKHDLIFNFCIFAGPSMSWARRDRNDHGLDGGNNRSFYSLNGAWYKSGRQKEIIDWVMETLDGLPNIILEVANEPFPFDAAWHTEMLHYMESKRQALGWDSLRYQVNPAWSQAADLGRIFADRLYISTHTHNTSVGFWNAIRDINPHTALPGGAVRSWDNGSYRHVPPDVITAHLEKAAETGNSIELFFLDWHEQSHEAVRAYIERAGR